MTLLCTVCIFLHINNNYFFIFSSILEYLNNYLFFRFKTNAKNDLDNPYFCPRKKYHVLSIIGYIIVPVQEKTKQNIENSPASIWVLKWSKRIKTDEKKYL